MTPPPHPNVPQVAILISTANDWGRRLVRGILAYANECGPWHIWVRPQAKGTVDHLPESWRGDGIITRVATPTLAKEITDQKLPVVNVADFKIEGFSAPCVRTDDLAGSRMAIQHFLERGLTNLAIVSADNTRNPAWYTKTFVEESRKQGIEANVFRVGKPSATQAKQLKEWLHALPKPVGILALGTHHARDVIDCCMRTGINVPHDVAVLSGGYDELLSHACFPALSGLLPPTEQIGYKAAELLHKMLKGEQVPHDTIFLPPRSVVERLSTETLAVDDPQLVKVVEYIREHAFESITMSDILREIPMARRSLERRFQKAFGRSPVDEIRRIRVHKARQLLAETDLPMQEIAEACGYATYNYLTSVFKQTTGTTPRDYRKQFRT